jgi:hypothetical protein
MNASIINFYPSLRYHDIRRGRQDDNDQDSLP